jgi:hypothetical protein
MIVIALDQQGALITIPGADGRRTLPVTFVDESEAVDLPTMIAARSLFGWHVTVGGLIHRDRIQDGIERQFVSAFFDSDRPSCGPVSEAAITRVRRGSPEATSGDPLIEQAVHLLFG